MKNPGRAGLTVDRFGDAKEWVPSDNSQPRSQDGSEDGEVNKVNQPVV
jgi:hypothetical protein